MAEQEIGNDAPDEATIYQIRIDLKGVRPPVWRRLLLYSDTRLDELHELIQVAMGWTNSHLHMFNSAGRDIGDVATAEWEIDSLDERDFYLGDVLETVGAKLQYEYDFGDGWQHVLKLEKILPADPDAEYPACIGGRRACPLEDVGGFPGYASFLEAYADPADPEHRELIEWAGEGFDPEYFDAQETTEALQDVWDELTQDDADQLHDATAVRFAMLSPEAADLLSNAARLTSADRLSGSPAASRNLRLLRKPSSLIDAMPIDDPLLVTQWRDRVVEIGPRMIPLLVERMVADDAVDDSEHAWVLGQLAVALQRLGPPSVPPLLKAFDALDDAGKAVACLVFGQLHVHETADRIWGFFEEAFELSEDWQVLAPIWALIDLDDPRAADAVALMLEDDWYCMDLAAMASRVGDRRAFAPLLVEAASRPAVVESAAVTATVIIAHRLGRETAIDLVRDLPRVLGSEAQATPEALVDALLSLSAEDAEAKMKRFFEPTTLADILLMGAEAATAQMDAAGLSEPDESWLDDTWPESVDNDTESLLADDPRDLDTEEAVPYAVMSPKRQFRLPYTRPGRNDPCWCGSGKRYRDCHWREDQQRDMPQAA